LIPWSPLEHYIYERILDLRIATPQIIINYAYAWLSRGMDILSIIVVMKFTFLLIVTFTSWNLQMLSVYIGLFRNTNTFKNPLGSHILVVHGVIWQDKTGAGERSVVYLVFFIAQASAELRSFVVASLNHYRFTGSSCIFILLA